MKIIILLMFCHTITAVQHVLIGYFTGSTGLTEFPAFEAVAEVNDIQAAYCNAKVIEAKQDWMQEILNDYPDQYQWAKSHCLGAPPFYRYIIDVIMKHFNQSEGIHIFQGSGGCELNMETKELTSFLKYGYDGEDFIGLDLNGPKWIALKKEALFLKQLWDQDTLNSHLNADRITNQCRQWLSEALTAGNETLFRTDYPSVCLLQKTPSSPVRCHATGFYPKSFLMFWRKDGEEIHEGVDPGEILNNEDNTFQYRIDLDISSIPRADWVRYDCVFQFTGAEDKILIKLEKEVIKTNRDESSRIRIIVIAVVSVVIAIIIIALAFTANKKRNERPLSPDSVDSENRSL